MKNSQGLSKENISDIIKKDAELSEKNLKKLKETKDVELFKTLEKERQAEYSESMNKLINKN
ncbi:MAG TPA: hypothetical protein VJ892_04790 [Candidatus Absconditabacterales bacterium]|nr:hypothetical protein [Candidatus Absconditabacterales bacterium]